MNETVIDVDNDIVHICACMTGRFDDRPDEHIEYCRDLELFLVELDHVTVWMCHWCVVGLEEW
jgi:hypothetical protein